MLAFATCLLASYYFVLVLPVPSLLEYAKQAKYILVARTASMLASGLLPCSHIQ